MQRVFLGLFFGSAMIALAGCASTNSRGETFDAGRVSQRLQTSMTQEQVINAIGWTPDSVEMETCGGQTGQSWQCKVLKFGTSNNNTLYVYMIPTTATDAVVSSWRVWRY